MAEEKRNNDKFIDDLCCRLEMACRYSPLDQEEISEQSMNDRRIIEGLYYYYRDKGKDPKTAERVAKVQAIKLILNEAFS